MQTEKASEILNVARKLMMDRGYNGFSFRDVAAEVGIKSASIHYHYPTKAELARAAARTYREDFSNALNALPSTNAIGMLSAYGSLFVATLRDHGRVCLGGILASDATTLPETVRYEVECFFEEQRLWLSQVLRKGQENGEIIATIDPDDFSAMFVSSLEGAMLVARGIGQPDHLAQSIDQLVQFAKA